MEKPALDRAMTLARQAKWEEVDKLVPSLVKDRNNLRRAVKELLPNRNRNVRDLGATLLQKVPEIEMFYGNTSSTLREVMVANSTHYDGFRAACALAVHYPKYYAKEIKETLSNFKEDKEVGKMAKKYLKEVEQY